MAFTSLVIFLFMGLYGYSVNPVDPPSKPGENTKVIAQLSPSQTDECSDMLSLVPITVIVTFTDCPDYVCEYPGLCKVEVCVYEFSTPPTLLGCQIFDPDDCQYTFNGLRANEGADIYAILVVTPSGCLHGYNDDPAYASNNPVPPGGGTMYVSTTYCE